MQVLKKWDSIKLKTILFYGCILYCCCACTREETSIILEEQEKYELLFNYGDRADRFWRTHIIRYFKLVALGSEYGDEFLILKKWVQPMKVYVSGNPDTALVAELHKIIDELNPLFSDGFQIQLVNDSLSSNYHIFLGDAATYSKMYPSTAHLLKNNSGLFTFYNDTDFNITSGHLFVDIVTTTSTFQKHILREELTQSLGLPNDLADYPYSIFYQQWSAVQEYSNLDLEIIRLLYHPRMVSRLGAASVDSVLRTILGV